MSEAFIKDFLEPIPVEDRRSPLQFAARPIAESAFHDFASYVFLFDPLPPGPFDDLPQGAKASFAHFAQPYLEIIYRVTVDEVPSRILSPDGYPLTRLYYPAYSDQALATEWFELFTSNAAPDLFEAYLTFVQEGAQRAEVELQLTFEQWFRNRARQLGQTALEMSEPAFWQGVAAPVAAGAASALQLSSEDFEDDVQAVDYGFRPFPSDVINFGLRLVYRQNWTPLGTQPGEIIRTLPLGPKQTEKVSVKFVRRNEVRRTFEQTISSETTTESTETTKDSSEVVAEASSTLKMHAEAEASGSTGFGSGKVSGGVSSETASSSKDTKARLNETMEKTASKIRNETKVTVSLTSETTFEESRASEITNPNEELAITYVYSRLQRQYEISTHLAEVNTVIFVPNEIA